MMSEGHCMRGAGAASGLLSLPRVRGRVGVGASRMHLVDVCHLPSPPPHAGEETTRRQP
jgi:hypothetical protein